MVWALKSTFYDLDQENAGFVRIGDMLSALSRVYWPPDATVSGSTAHDEETNGGGDAGMLVDVLRGLGVGVAEGGYGCGHGGGESSPRGIGLACPLRYIQHILNPRVSVMWFSFPTCVAKIDQFDNGRSHPMTGPRRLRHKRAG